jgi:hypothetical protein
MSEEKKIIIDEDWKSRVAAEKEATATRQTVASSESGDRGAPSTETPAGPGQAHGSLPPASFELLVTGFVTEAMVALGQLPHPVTGKAEPDKEHARYAIDMLQVLADKTRGNLEPGEERGLREVLHQLRMAFVAFGLPADEPDDGGR